MIIVNDINTTQFEINGIRYFKNFTPVVRNNFISISNTYGSNITLCDFTHFNQFEVNGVFHASVQETQIALLPILFTRVSLIDIQNTLPDGLLSSGTITVVGQNVNFSTGFNARIQGVLVSNNVQSFLLPLAVESRFDSFGINNLGVIIRIAGDDQENPFLPNIPANVIYITSVLVSSTSVGQPSAPELTGFVQKIYSSVQNVFDVTTFELPSNGSTYFRFVHQNGNLNFNGFTNANNNPELFEGKDFYIENQSDFTLALTTGAGIRPADALTIPARKLAHYKYRGGKLYLVAKSWEDAPQIDFATQAENEAAATATDLNNINNTKATTPRGLRWFWNSLRAIAWSWSGKQTFWGGVNMGSLTASRWLRLNGDKDIESFDGQALLDGKVDKIYLPLPLTGNINVSTLEQNRIYVVTLGGADRTITIDVPTNILFIIKGSKTLHFDGDVESQNEILSVSGNGNSMLIENIGDVNSLASLNGIVNINPNNYPLNVFPQPATQRFLRQGVDLKNGSVPATSFTGTPLIFDVSFPPFPAGTNYSINIGSADARTWSHPVKNEGGFRINSNSSTPLTGEVTWTIFIIS